MGLLALMLLHESRRAARTSPDGRADPAGGPGPLALGPGADRGGHGAGGAGAALAALRPLHAAGGDRGRARRGARPRPRPTGPQIVGLYDVLAQVEPSPVVELNRAVAVAMRDGPAAGLALIDAILARGDAGRVPPGPLRARRAAAAASAGPRTPRAAYQRALALAPGAASAASSSAGCANCLD